MIPFHSLATLAKSGSIGPGESDLRFHHLGVACTDLDKESRQFAELGYLPEGPDFIDPVQGVRGRFLAGQPRLELLTPLDKAGVLEPWLKQRAKLYHIAYETPSIDKTVIRLQTQRARLITGPVPATAFGGRAIAFLMLPNMIMIELIAAPITSQYDERISGHEQRGQPT